MLDLEPNIGEKSTGKTIEILAEKTGVPKTRLETIMEVGKLAETGKTKNPLSYWKWAYSQAHGGVFSV